MIVVIITAIIITIIINILSLSESYYAPDKKVCKMR